MSILPQFILYLEIINGKEKLKMDFKRGLLLGLVVGLLLEWLIDHWLWPRDEKGLVVEGEVKGQRLLTAENAVSRLQAELAEMRQKLARAEEKQPLDQPQRKRKQPAAKLAAPQQDPLEQVRGIGAVFARRLYEAGIHTFQQLAELSPEQVREIVQVNEWQKIDPTSWIAQAKELGAARGGSGGQSGD
jgi:predicted flap endonuclease-1-like 5' DNA nuclease